MLHLSEVRLINKGSWIVNRLGQAQLQEGEEPEDKCQARPSFGVGAETKFQITTPSGRQSIDP
jgi:hypothetical protein